MKIHRPSLRLALWYELIVVCISLAYSIAVYQISTRQIESGLRQQVDIFQQRQPNSYPFQTYEDELLTAQLQEVRRRLLITLVIINSIIVVAAGGTSYILARRTLRPIEESLEQQRRFTADASHELRTPLAAMQAEIEVALRAATANPQEYAQVLQSNLEEIHRLERLSHGLLRLARGEKQNTSFQAKPTPVSAVVDDAIRQVTPHAERKNITIDRAEISGSIQGEQHGLVELLVILLDNAIKYSDLKTTVRITAEPGNRTVTLRVQDHGIGIKASELPHIFDRFYRADISRSKNHVEGYGLGLPIAKQIVELHHGKIQVSSEVGVGSSFAVILPRAKS